MHIRQKLVLLSILWAVLLGLQTCSEDIAELEKQKTSTSINQPQVENSIPKNKNNKNQTKQQQQTCQKLNIKFIQTDNQGNNNSQGLNNVILFDPKSQELDFKVSLGLAHNLYAKDAQGKFRTEYIPKHFREIIGDENAQLNGRRPFAAINGDYIDPENKPQGFNSSRGVEYSGAFKDQRSSFGISGGRPEERRATIQKGRRKEQILNYNVVGGNGRFYQNGKFKDICNDLGEYACTQETSRSMVAITAKGYVIWLVNNSYGEQALYPDSFDKVLERIAKNHCLGKIQEGMLFDGGFSTGLYFDNRVYVENPNPIGSVFLIYKK